MEKRDSKEKEGVLLRDFMIVKFRILKTVEEVNIELLLYLIDKERKYS